MRLNIFKIIEFILVIALLVSISVNASRLFKSKPKQLTINQNTDMQVDDNLKTEKTYKITLYIGWSDNRVEQINSTFTPAKPNETTEIKFESLNIEE